MKRSILLLLAAGSLLLALSGCRSLINPCADACCLPGGYHFSLRLVSASTGAGLVFGPGKTYDFESLRLYEMVPGEKRLVPLSASSTSYSNAPADSVIGVSYYSLTPAMLLEFGDGDVDTLNLRYQSTGVSECCGEGWVFAGLRYNDGAEQTPEQGVLVVRK